MSNSNVRVSVRVRPQIPRDLLDLCHVCTHVPAKEPQIWVGKDKVFTFDEVYDMATTQLDIYDNNVKLLVDGCIEGYNATVLAYGQTGSGKTYTMGTGFDLNMNHDECGIIPRAIDDLFKKIVEKQEIAKECGNAVPEFKVNVQFMELYNEEVIDLLDTSRDNEDKGKRTNIKIHQDASGAIYTHGINAQCVTSAKEALECLKQGSLSRTTAITGMNLQSSRSHAIFTLHIKQQRIVQFKSMDNNNICDSSWQEQEKSIQEFETLTSKFHFVDLAGSERLKRTKATGERQREGISINSGLLTLGNVISALGERSKRNSHVPYRDSKLTRLLQDSLGGNSRTLMIACVSPSDKDFMETLNTLKYANRAKNIKNKIVVNMDKTSQTISFLRHEIENLKLELMEYKQGKRMIAQDGTEHVDDMYHENKMLHAENTNMKTRIKALQETVDKLTQSNVRLLVEKSSGNWITGEGTSDITSVIEGYIREIEILRAKLLEAEETCIYLRKLNQKAQPFFTSVCTVSVTGEYDIRTESSSVHELLQQAKADVKILKEKKKKLKDANKEKQAIDDEKDVDQKNESSEEDEDLSEEESSSESEGEKEIDSKDLADLTCEISLKEKLINQLEKSQRCVFNIKKKYEEKIIQLQRKMEETAKERDRVLKTRGLETPMDNKTRHVIEDYEKQLSTLRKNLKQMQAAEREHSQALKTRSDHEKQMKKLRNELAEMKKAKVVLCNKMSRETKKHKDNELINAREISKLQKDRSVKEHKIKILEGEKKTTETVLKKKQQELLALKRSVLTSARSNMRPRSQNSVSSLNIAKQKWQHLEKKINMTVVNRQSVTNIEKEMERFLHEREDLCRQLEDLIKKKNRALLELGTDPNFIVRLQEDIESVKSHIDYIQDNINSSQMCIVQLEEKQDDSEILRALGNVSPAESNYVMGKLLHMAISQSLLASQRECALKEAEAEIKQAEETNNLQEQLLLHLFQKSDENLGWRSEVSDVSYEHDYNGSVGSSCPSSPIDGSQLSDGTFIMDKARQRKAREIDVTPESLLFSQSNEDDVFPEPFEQDGKTSPSKPQESLISGNWNNDDKPIGKIIPYDYSSVHRQNSQHLVCTHIVEGHTQGVLALDCTDNLLFSSSEDSTVKIWDLYSGKELQQLTNHPDAVVKVKYSDFSQLLFTVSSSYVKIWDLRKEPSKCLYTLDSSGKRSSMNLNLDYTWTTPSSDLTNLTSDTITDIGLNHMGNTLFSSSSTAIRVWDLRQVKSVGILNSGYQSRVSCLVVDDSRNGKNLVACGTKDSNIKGFDVAEDMKGIQEADFVLKDNFNHAVHALAVNGNTLFSSSSNKSISKWNVSTQKLVKRKRDAHQDFIGTLNIIPKSEILLSGCQSGYVNIWSVDSCELVEEIRCHGSAINAIASTKDRVFTASNDCTVGIWAMGGS